MAIIDTLITRYTMDPSGYVAGAAKVKGATNDVAASIRGIQSGGQGGLGGLAAALTSPWALAGLAITSVTAALAGLGKVALGAMQEAARWDSLAKSLNAVEGSAKNAGIAMDRLRQIAKAPGIGLEETFQGYLGLRRSGVSPMASELMIQQFGNANALSGGSKEEFGQIMLALKQMLMQPFLRGQELMQLTNAGLPAYKMAHDAFGTADTEELKKRGITSAMVVYALTKSLMDLPRVASGAQNSFDNLSDAMKYSVATVGAVLNKEFLPYFDEFSTVLATMASGGILADVVKSFSLVSTGGLSLKESMIGLAAWLATVAEQLSNYMDAYMRATDAAMRLDMQGLRQAIGDELGAFSDSAGAANYAANKARYEFMMKQEEKKSPKIGDGGLGDLAKAAGESITAPIVQQHQTLQKIENNTRKALDIQRQVFGGGAIGEKGVSAADIAGFSKGRKSGKAKLDDAVRMIAAYVVEEIGMHRLREVRAKVGSL